MTEEELVNSLEIFAHKLKNPIHAVGINLDVIKMKLKKANAGIGDLEKHLDIAISESQRVNKIIANFIEYLKLPELQKRKVNLREYLHG